MFLPAVLMYRVGQKSGARDAWPYFYQNLTDLMHFVHLASTLLKDKESVRDNHALACNFAKYSPI